MIFPSFCVSSHKLITQFFCVVSKNPQNKIIDHRHCLLYYCNTQHNEPRTRMEFLHISLLWANDDVIISFIYAFKIDNINILLFNSFFFLFLPQTALTLPCILFQLFYLSSVLFLLTPIALPFIVYWWYYFLLF